ncbi:MAG TPA: methionine--tRNA ligase [Alphaproteobacteria bacterium]|jgi:methionyl-tRNA synthetase|nr:methionine--tRNA ligase [Alphaproteobacteria bacterium]
MPAPYYITTPIYYVNDAPHIGHAYTTLACDVLARFMRLDGRRVMFLTGTDEHGQKVEKAAAAAGQDPQRFVDNVSENFRTLTRAMNFSNDDFIRTTEPRHKHACQALWKEVVARKSPQGRDNIYLEKYGGWYAVRDEAYYGEDELTTGADGKKRAPSGAEVDWVEEPSYFFRLSDWQDRLLEFYEANKDCIGPDSRRNEVTSFVKSGLRDLSLSRTSFKWGIPVPGDPDHVMYVWFDALANYLTAVGYPDTNAELFSAFWPANLHMVGKDILRFHAVYWPAFLMAAGIAPPQRVFAHGWWTNEGQKISKSLGNVIDPLALVATYGLDPVRYFLLREVPFGLDGDFSHKAMVHRTNSDLANDYGNLAQRVLSMIAKNCVAQVPQPGEFTPEDEALMARGAQALSGEIRGAMETQAFHEALDAVWAVIRAGNRYVDEQAPWALKKTDMARMGTVLYSLAETIRQVAILTQPFMPESSAKILDQLAVPQDARTLAHIGSEYRLEAGTPLPAPVGVFPRYVGEAADAG